ncbi:MAG: NUDIX domain-containing protein [Anaerolineae bacterium]|nr:NUDIX domain-containing protein [Anaerolineae bacterium]
MGAHEQGANATQGRWLVIPRTLCFVLNGGDILLMKRGPHKRVFPNQYNGLGGHIERDEDPYTSARREIAEESGLNVHSIQLRAVYNIDTRESTGILLFVFTAWSDSRDITPNDEGTLHWIPLDKVSELDLVEDLPVILPRIWALDKDAAPLYVHVSYSDQDVIQMRFAES